MTEGKKEMSQQTKYVNNDAAVGFWGSVSGATFAAIVIGACFAIDKHNKATAPYREAEAERQFLTTLKDPAVTDRIIAQLRKPETQAILSDPEVMTNMQKLLHAIDGEVKQTIEAKIEELKSRRVTLDELAPKESTTWAKKTVEKALEKKTTERGN